MLTKIKISEDIKCRLDSLKDYPEQSHEDIIKKLIRIAAEENIRL